MVLNPLALAGCSESASDIIILIASDHPYINVAVVRFFAEYFNLRYREAHGGTEDVISIYGVEEGFQRKDTREFLGFDDGIDNISMREDELESLVYINEADNEPDWCVNGTYLVYRKIRENSRKNGKPLGLLIRIVEACPNRISAATIAIDSYFDDLLASYSPVIKPY